MLDRLEALAREAEPGEWTASEPNGRGRGWKVGPAWLGGSAWSAETAANAAHIAAFDPPTVLRLIAVARAAKRLIGYMESAECGPLDAPADALRSALAELEDAK